MGVAGNRAIVQGQIAVTTAQIDGRTTAVLGKIALQGTAFQSHSGCVQTHSAAGTTGGGVAFNPASPQCCSAVLYIYSAALHSGIVPEDTILSGNRSGSAIQIQGTAIPLVGIVFKNNILKVAGGVRIAVVCPHLDSATIAF